MTDVGNQQEVTLPLMDVPRVAGNFIDEIEEFIVGLSLYDENIFGRELLQDEENEYRQILPLWNTFLQSVQGIQSTSAFVSSDIKEDINKFIPWLRERRGAEWTEGKKKLIKKWLPRWNMLLEARAGKTLVTCVHLCLTIMGFILYIVDLVTDISTSIYYASNRQWWQATVTLALVYGAVIIHTVVKWTDGLLYCTGPLLCYVASLLVNWPDVKQYWAYCLLEWKMWKSPANSAHLVAEWHQRKLNIAHLKFMEGLWEACPQVILQLYLLVPNLHGSWTDCLRIAKAFVSLCSAGAALVNWEKYRRFHKHIDVPMTELVVLYVWAVSVTGARLLSVALLLTVHPYWALAGIALHLVLRGVRWCKTEGVPRALHDVIDMYQVTLQFFVSPFDVAWPITYRRVLHAIHFLVNTGGTVGWALGTTLMSNPALYAAIICLNAVMFSVGLLGMELHEKYWPDCYFT